MQIKRWIVATLLWLIAVPAAQAQSDALRFATVERPPFAMEGEGDATGFSIALVRAIGDQLNREVEFVFYDTFPAMLAAAETGQVDGAVANISITAARERAMDFSQPIYEGGVGVLLEDQQTVNPILTVLLRWDIWGYLMAALAVLFGMGMLMWVFERRAQPYFDRPGRDALFPSFWWALNMVVNGGFEERMPQSRLGRLFAVLLVVSSLFVVSIFVAAITSAVTVAALQDNIDSINDLEGQRVASIEGSTSAEFLDARDLDFVAYPSPADIFADLEAGLIDAVVFDAPILFYYSNITTEPQTRLLPRIYRPENYGIVVQSGSPLREQINRELLRLREDGTYDDLVVDWFGRP